MVRGANDRGRRVAGGVVISVASVDYCERCRCKTLHIPTPEGGRICEWHLREPESQPAPPARPAPEQNERSR